MRGAQAADEKGAARATYAAACLLEDFEHRACSRRCEAVTEHRRKDPAGRGVGAHVSPRHTRDGIAYCCCRA
jgi:hypothetical protein